MALYEVECDTGDMSGAVDTHGERACEITEGFVEEVVYAEFCWMGTRQPDEGAGDACVLGRKNKKHEKHSRRLEPGGGTFGRWLEREAGPDPQGCGSH